VCGAAAVKMTALSSVFVFVFWMNFCGRDQIARSSHLNSSS
jgi:hypothetical protein